MAFVLSVTEKELPVTEEKLGGFSKMLMRIMDAGGEGIVRTWTVSSPYCHPAALSQEPGIDRVHVLVEHPIHAGRYCSRQHACLQSGWALC